MRAPSRHALRATVLAALAVLLIGPGGAYAAPRPAAPPVAPQATLTVCPAGPPDCDYVGKDKLCG